MRGGAGFTFRRLRVHNMHMAQETPLRRLRQSRNLTLDQVAEKVGVSQSQISRWETGSSDIPGRRLEALASALGVTGDEIAMLTGDDGAAARQAGARRAGSKPPIADVIPIFSSRLTTPVTLDGKEIETLFRSSIASAGTHIERPASLANRNDVYAMGYYGQGMEPAVIDGELVLVTASHIRMGDLVAINLQDSNASRDGNRVMIKRLVGRTPDSIELEQLSPPLRFKIPHENIASIERLVHLEELLTLVIA